MPEHSKQQDALALVLVIVQFTCAGILIFLGAQGSFGVLELALIILGTTIGIAAILSMRIGNLKILPNPKEYAILITTGMYNTIRHPMYLAVLLVCGGFALTAASEAATGAWFVLLADLIAKLRYEEKLLVQAFKNYEAYMSRTKRLIPFIW